MSTLQTLTDAGARAVAEYADRLARRLDGLNGRLCEAVAQAVGEAVAGAVEAAVSAALDEFAAGQVSAGRYDPSAGGHAGYWGDPDDGWGTPEDRYEPRRATRRDNDERAGESTACNGPRRRWLQVALLTVQVVAGWLDRQRQRPRWLAATAAGLVVALTTLTVAPGGGLAGGVSNLAFLAGLLRSGSGLLSDLT
jgi:hypothetical protein